MKVDKYLTLMSYAINMSHVKYFYPEGNLIKVYFAKEEVLLFAFSDEKTANSISKMIQRFWKQRNQIGLEIKTKEGNVKVYTFS